MEKKRKGRLYPEIEELSKSHKESFISLVSEVFLESPEAMWYERLPTEKELLSLFNAKIQGSRSGAVIDMVFKTGNRLLCECEIVRLDKNRAVVGIITRAERKGTGVSDALLQGAEKRAMEMDIKELIAEVKRSNQRAIEFFTRNGFAEQEEHAGIVMLSKKLKL